MCWVPSTTGRRRISPCLRRWQASWGTERTRASTVRGRHQRHEWEDLQQQLCPVCGGCTVDDYMDDLKKGRDTMVTIGSARIDENGKAHGGKAGDQTGKEVSTQDRYKHSKGWRVLRANDVSARDKIAVAMERACANSNIGYDQWQRWCASAAVTPSAATSCLRPRPMRDSRRRTCAGFCFLRGSSLNSRVLNIRITPTT